MLIITNIYNNKKLEFESSTELKKFLEIQNPTGLKKYKNQIIKKIPSLTIVGIGKGIRISKK